MKPKKKTVTPRKDYIAWNDYLYELKAWPTSKLREVTGATRQQIFRARQLRGIIAPVKETGGRPKWDAKLK